MNLPDNLFGDGPFRLSDRTVELMARTPEDCDDNSDLIAYHLAVEVQDFRRLAAACAEHGGIERVVAMGLAAPALLTAARALANASEAEMIRLTALTNPDGDFRCPADPCPYCTAMDDFLGADMAYDDVIPPYGEDGTA